MTSLTDIEKKVLSHTRYGERLRPVRDWLILLSMAGVIFLLSAAWNVWIYVRVASGESVGTASSVPAQAVNTNAIDTAQTVFGARASEEASYEHVYHFVDPSK